MNNYPGFINYNYDNLFMDNFFKDDLSDSNWYKKENQLYDPYNGLIRGNLFKNLYAPYKNKEPYEIKPVNEQARMLTNIDTLCFSMIDLNLYLDVYPDDKEKLNLFNQYRSKYLSFLDDYESKYGPITLNSNSLMSYPWSWDDMPWPWDN